METRMVLAFAVTILAICVTFTLYFNQKGEQIARMVQAGASPLEAACALHGDNSQLNNCTLVFGRKP